ncbi:MAG: ribosome biogenesis GTPase YlqF [Ruminococcus sp.]|nr:ribosome biogenesis GTPase YlqF [Ruminococcus sp.]
MSEMQNIQWFPGHMTKTKRQIEKNLKLVDAVAEIIDARIPVSSRNPDIAQLVTNKPRIILMNKCDMADEKATRLWIEHFKKQGIIALAIDCKSNKGINSFIPALKNALQNKIDSYKRKGMLNPSMRVMIVGIPNVGKSTFINRIFKQNKAKTADKPGVTRGNQWFTISKGFEMLDTPGVLWPKFDDQLTGERLAFTGAIKDQIIDVELLAVRLLDLLKELKTPDFIARFKLDENILSDNDNYELLQIIAKKRGMLISGGEADTERAAIMLLDEFRAAKLGRITLELPD